MLINQIINVEVTAGESPPVAEPVTIQEMKDYLRTEGFIPNEGSPADDFDFDDILIEDQISEGRGYVERLTGVHVIPKTIEVTFWNQAGGQEMPGPVTSTVSLTDLDGNVKSNPVWIGTRFPSLKTCYAHELVATYQVGYTGNSPGWVRNAIKAYVAWAYSHRGDEENLKGSPERAAAICRVNKRLSAWG